MDVTDRWR